jgi:Spy/CpxP family protein refolding chaperone
MSNRKLMGAVLFLAAALVIFGWRYRAATSPVKPTAPVGKAALPMAEARSIGKRGPIGHARDNPELRKQKPEQFFQDLNLTAEQQTKMDEIEKEMAGKTGREAWTATREAISKVLTPEQMQKLAQTAAARDSKMAAERFKVLPPEERAKIEKKLNQKVKRDAQRFAATH